MKKLTLIALACILPMNLFMVHAQTQPELTGNWKGTAILNTGEADALKIVFKKVDGKLTGVVNDEFGMCQNATMQNLTIKGDMISFMLEVHEGDEVMDISLEGKIKGNSIKGTWTDEYSGTSSTWEAEKVVKKEINLTGTWEGHAVLDTGDLDPLVITLLHKDGKLSGTVTDEFGMLTDSPLIDLKLTGKKITYILEVDNQSGILEVHLQGEIEGNKIKGEWMDEASGGGGTWEVTFKKE